MNVQIKINLVTHNNYLINNFKYLNLTYDNNTYTGKFNYSDDDLDEIKIKSKNILEKIFMNIKAGTRITYDLLDLFKSILQKIDNVNNLNDEYIESSLNGNYEGSYIRIYFTDNIIHSNNVYLAIHNHEYGYEILKAFDTEQAAKNYKRFYGIRHKNLNSINIIEIPIESDSKLFTIYNKEDND